MIYRCPDSVHLNWPEHGPLYVVGCGYIFEATPDDDGFVDCPSCGMWFDAARNEWASTPDDDA